MRTNYMYKNRRTQLAALLKKINERQAWQCEGNKESVCAQFRCRSQSNRESKTISGPDADWCMHPIGLSLWCKPTRHQTTP